MIVDRLMKKIEKMKNPTVVGLDPMPEYIPPFLIEKNFEIYGKTLQGMAEAVYEFNQGLIDALQDIVPAVKPQIAMYEQYGYRGMEAYEKTVRYAKEKGMIVIGDIKRGDIASTAKAYANGHLGRVSIDGVKMPVYDTDFITLNPYLGTDAIEPFLADCRAYDKGLFVLVKTSNPGSGVLQDLNTENVPLYEKVGRLVADWGEPFIGEYGYSVIGAVVGATHPLQAERLRKMMPHTFFLVPGYGAQGGQAKDIAVCFDNNGQGAIVNSSREIICAYQKKEYREKSFGQAAREAALAMKEDLCRVTG